PAAGGETLRGAPGGHGRGGRPQLRPAVGDAPRRLHEGRRRVPLDRRGRGGLEGEGRGGRGHEEGEGDGELHPSCSFRDVTRSNVFQCVSVPEIHTTSSSVVAQYVNQYLAVAVLAGPICRYIKIQDGRLHQAGAADQSANALGGRSPGNTRRGAADRSRPHRGGNAEAHRAMGHSADRDDGVRLRTGQVPVRAALPRVRPALGVARRRRLATVRRPPRRAREGPAERAPERLRFEARDVQGRRGRRRSQRPGRGEANALNLMRVLHFD
ncbi:hypothetical protein THAOC_33902, partial [Thalassiosira oceanica]